MGCIVSPDDLKLKRILVDVLLIEDNQYDDKNGPTEIDTWDSLAVVHIAVSVEAEFGYAMTPEEMVSLDSIEDIKRILREKRVAFLS